MNKIYSTLNMKQNKNLRNFCGELDDKEKKKDHSLGSCNQIKNGPWLYNLPPSFLLVAQDIPQWFLF